VKGAKKLKDEFLCKLDDEYKERIFKELIRKHADFICLKEKDKMPKIENELSETKKNGELEIKIKELLDNFDETYNKGFVSGIFQIDYLFAAIGLNRPICKFDAKEGKHRTFFPDGRIEEGIDYDYSTVGEPIYVGEITGHAEALIPIDSENSQNVKNSTELDKKALEMKNLIKERISSVIYDAIYDADKRDDELRRIITEKEPSYCTDSFIKKLIKDDEFCKKAKENKPEFFHAIQVFDRILPEISREKREDLHYLEISMKGYLKDKFHSKEESSSHHKNILKKFVNIFIEKAIELCQKKPLFWDNVENSVLNLW
jgi:hypothetical protein